jgi:hypothetical protein
MPNPSISLDDAIVFLNEALALDPEGITRLVNARVPCNLALADHPTIQCGVVSLGPLAHEVGLLGILNGLFGIRDDGWGHIAVAYEDNSLAKIIGFEKTPDQKRVDLVLT